MDKRRLQQLAGIVTESRDEPYDLGNGWSHEVKTEYEDDNVKDFHYLVGPDGKKHPLHVSPYRGGEGVSDNALRTYIDFYERFGRMPNYGEFTPGNIMRKEDIARIRQAIETGKLPTNENLSESVDYISPTAALRLAKELHSQLKVGKVRQAEGTVNSLIRILEKIVDADERAEGDVEDDYPSEDVPMFLRRQTY